MPEAQLENPSPALTGEVAASVVCERALSEAKKYSRGGRWGNRVNPLSIYILRCVER